MDTPKVKYFSGYISLKLQKRNAYISEQSEQNRKLKIKNVKTPDKSDAYLDAS